MARRKGYYAISAVAKMLDVHQQTIRVYEKEGLINPRRTTGGTRIFTDEDVDRLEEIINLTQKMGVNLAGVNLVLKLQKKIARLQNEVNKLFSLTQESLEEESGGYKAEAEKSAHRLVEMKRRVVRREVTGPTEKPSGEKKEAIEPEVVEDWEVDYDDE